MQQTPMHDTHNAEVLGMIPKNAKRIIEIGCSSGALAREVKKSTKKCITWGLKSIHLMQKERVDTARNDCYRY